MKVTTETVCEEEKKTKNEEKCRRQMRAFLEEKKSLWPKHKAKLSLESGDGFNSFPANVENVLSSQ
jgi:hypothetical protein